MVLHGICTVSTWLVANFVHQQSEMSASAVMSTSPVLRRSWKHNCWPPARRHRFKKMEVEEPSVLSLPMSSVSTVYPWGNLTDATNFQNTALKSYFWVSMGLNFLESTGKSFTSSSTLTGGHPGKNQRFPKDWDFKAFSGWSSRGWCAHAGRVNVMCS